MPISQMLKDILVCPACKGALTEASNRLICNKCKLAYPVRADIPVMLIEEAEKL